VSSVVKTMLLADYKYTDMPIKMYYLLLSQPSTELPRQLVSIAEHKRNGGPSQQSARVTVVSFEALKITLLGSSSSSKANRK
jgi:hypothetical protein